ncbi:MAG: nicotinic acid mononucleotide adenylyltransferase [Gemmataceae bacterium]|nr:nicotinic acid mononucleotide adenylyltransferase [Gemmataceae bacterium]
MLWTLLASRPAVCREPDGTVRADGPRPGAVLPGSFNPLHHGHTTLAAVAGHRLGLPVAFELSVANVDKPGLAPEEVARRVAQFAGVGPVWVTRAATFAEKADLFPGAAFVVGFDTATRLVDPKYYRDDPARRDDALRHLLARGCRVVVGGRADAAGAFRTWTAGDLAAEFHGLFLPLAETDFRADVSSTALRTGKAKRPPDKTGGR